MKDDDTRAHTYKAKALRRGWVGVVLLLSLVLVKSAPVRRLLVEHAARCHPGDVRCATALARFYLLKGMFGTTAPGPGDRAALRECSARVEHVLQVLSEVPEIDRNAEFRYWWAGAITARYEYGQPNGDRRLRQDAAQALDQALSVGSSDYRPELKAWLHCMRGRMAWDGAGYSRALWEAETAVQLQPSQPAYHLLLFEATIATEEHNKNRDDHRVEAALAAFHPWLGKLNDKDQKEAQEYIKKAHDLLRR